MTPVLLAYKVKSSKWLGGRMGERLAAPAAHVYCELDLKDDTVSFWRVGATGEDLDLVALALMTSASNVQPMDLVLIPEAEVRGYGIDIRPEVPGDTPFPAANGLHVDLTNLTAEQAYRLALAVFDRALSVGSPLRFKRFGKPAMRALLRTNAHRLNSARLSDSIRRDAGLAEPT